MTTKRKRKSRSRHLRGFAIGPLPSPVFDRAQSLRPQHTGSMSLSSSCASRSRNRSSSPLLQSSNPYSLSSRELLRSLSLSYRILLGVALLLAAGTADGSISLAPDASSWSSTSPISRCRVGGAATSESTSHGAGALLFASIASSPLVS
eukprot:CAMPEP_0173404604 /NCGR_PEP_ID=MMETSP1356-20130122/59794_1 /TAXON_ID=77927 ORGANISM="Hemiselmis virescens, Strain PCC157" /NCGR_SAMPLE_ID=MMETSP1356 /ASSEMBLY_ACC=CAM_ASM_000847 /LENGTH=148 /DNA_ID=CAMNT_0014365303 /DNA_START=27 /DNA_END=469 /DNA_ORIENTATION=+